MVGLLGESVQDIDETKRWLLDQFDMLERENYRQESNNLLQLFFLIDKDQSSTLDKEEIARLREYIHTVYNEDYDFSRLDRDRDGHISIKEFFRKFRGRNTR